LLLKVSGWGCVNICQFSADQRLRIISGMLRRIAARIVYHIYDIRCLTSLIASGLSSTTHYKLPGKYSMMIIYHSTSVITTLESTTISETFTLGPFHNPFDGHRGRCNLSTNTHVVWASRTSKLRRTRRSLHLFRCFLMSPVQGARLLRLANACLCVK
jgi:hypothetical protein